MQLKHFLRLELDAYNMRATALYLSFSLSMMYFFTTIRIDRCINRVFLLQLPLFLFSSKRAQLVSHTLVPRAGAHHENSNSISHLPSIHESHTHHHYSQHPSQQHHHHQQQQQGMLRAQTEPGMLYASANHLNDGYGGNDNLPSKPAGKKKKKA